MHDFAAKRRRVARRVIDAKVTGEPLDPQVAELYMTLATARVRAKAEGQKWSDVWPSLERNSGIPVPPNWRG